MYAGEILSLSCSSARSCLLAVKAHFMSAECHTVWHENGANEQHRSPETTDSLVLRKLNKCHPHCEGNALLVQSNCHLNNCLEKISFSHTD